MAQPAGELQSMAGRLRVTLRPASRSECGVGPRPASCLRRSVDRSVAPCTERFESLGRYWIAPIARSLAAATRAPPRRGRPARAADDRDILIRDEAGGWVWSEPMRSISCWRPMTDGVDR